LERSVCLFGNLDSVYILQMGTPQDVARETRRQMNACAAGGFIMANGCPLSFGTHPENVRAMIQTARGMAGDD
jgi:uroporphyrinogen-III decarboxylase